MCFAPLSLAKSAPQALPFGTANGKSKETVGYPIGEAKGRLSSHERGHFRPSLFVSFKALHTSLKTTRCPSPQRPVLSPLKTDPCPPPRRAHYTRGFVPWAGGRTPPRRHVASRRIAVGLALGSGCCTRVVLQRRVSNMHPAAHPRSAATSCDQGYRTGGLEHR
jgi:hypothetical protein